MTKPIAVCSVSGGLDSSVLAYLMKSQGYDLRLLSFDYGQRHRRELESARMIAEELGAPWHLVDLKGLRVLLKGSALTDDSVDVPKGHYTSETQKLTVVPNRNMIFASILAGYAISEGADVLSLGVHASDYQTYPDCRPDFIDRLEGIVLSGNEGFIKPEFRVETPLLYKNKTEILRMALDLGVPIEKTWSCYGGDVKVDCVCGTCSEILEGSLIIAAERGITPEEVYPHFKGLDIKAAAAFLGL